MGRGVRGRCARWQRAGGGRGRGWEIHGVRLCRIVWLGQEDTPGGTCVYNSRRKCTSTLIAISL